MATFVSDTFTGADGTDLASHTGETGATWTEHGSYATGAFGVQTNFGTSRAAAASLYYASGVPAGAEYTVTGLFVQASSIDLSASARLYLYGRVNTAADTYYRLVIDPASSSTVFLQKVVAGVATALGSAAAYAEGDATYALELTDAAKRVLKDGVEIITSADNAIAAAGKAGVGGAVSMPASGRYIAWASVTAADVAASAVTTPTGATMGVGP